MRKFFLRSASDQYRIKECLILDDVQGLQQVPSFPRIYVSSIVLYFNKTSRVLCVYVRMEEHYIEPDEPDTATRMRNLALRRSVTS